MTDSRAASTPRFGTGRTSYMYGFVLHSVGIHRREVDEQTVLVPHGAKIRSELCRPSGAVPHATKQGRRPSTTGSTSDAPLHLYNPPQPQRFQPRELRQATCAQRCPGPRRSPERRAIRTGRSRTHLASTVTDQPVHSVVVPDDLEQSPRCSRQRRARAQPQASDEQGPSDNGALPQWRCWGCCGVSRWTCWPCRRWCHRWASLDSDQEALLRDGQSPDGAERASAGRCCVRLGRGRDCPTDRYW